MTTLTRQVDLPAQPSIVAPALIITIGALLLLVSTAWLGIMTGRSEQRLETAKEQITELGRRVHSFEPIAVDVSGDAYVTISCTHDRPDHVRCIANHTHIEERWSRHSTQPTGVPQNNTGTRSISIPKWQGSNTIGDSSLVWDGAAWSDVHTVSGSIDP